MAPTVRGPGYPPAPPSDHWYGGPGVSLGDSEAWKPQKVGGCEFTRCPQNLVLSHVAQDTACSWFWGYSQELHIFWAILAIFEPFLGHIVELEGNKRLFVTGQSRRTWSLATISVRLAILGQKRLFRGTKCAVLGGHLPTWRPRPGAPPVSFWLKTWIWQGHHLGSRG